MITLVFISLAVVIGAAIWFWLQGKRCVTCSAFHIDEDEIYRCEQCYRPICKDNVFVRELNSFVQQGYFSRAQGTVFTGRISINNRVYCGDLIHQITNEGETWYCLCSEHSQ